MISMASRINLDGPVEDAGIDMTPMLDVVFIMLIFFIVSTTFVRDEGVEINTPSASQAVAQAGNGIVVSLDAQGGIWLDGVVLTLAQLGDQLQRERLQAERPVLIKADTQVSTGALIELLDSVKALGIDKVAVATQKEAS